MAHARLICLNVAAMLAAAGLIAAAAFGLQGALDQAIAFSWPAFGAAVMLALIAPARAAEPTRLQDVSALQPRDFLKIAKRPDIPAGGRNRFRGT